MNGHFLISRYQGGFEHSIHLDWPVDCDFSKFLDFVVFHTLAQNTIVLTNGNLSNSFKKYDLFNKLSDHFQQSSEKEVEQWHFEINQIEMFNMISGVWTHTWIPNSNLLKHHV